MQNGFVILMGLGTVFFGLICIVILCRVMSAVVNKFVKAESISSDSISIVKGTPVINKSEIVAAVSAAVAEDLGTNVSGIRIHSLKKI